VSSPPIYDIRGKRVWVAGEHGMVGSALIRRLARENCSFLHMPRRAIDFREQSATSILIKSCKPQVIFLAAAQTGGIAAKVSRPAEFLYDNLLIAANIIHAAYNAGVERLMFIGSTSVYPRDAPHPTPEKVLLTGPLDGTSEWNAVAKIAGVKLTQAYRRQYGSNFICCHPAKLYGPGDSYDPETSTVIPALIRRTHEAKLAGSRSVTVWGSGRPMREFLHVDDFADAAVFLMRHYDGEIPINVGSREEISIAGLARLIAKVVGFEGEIDFDPSRPDGQARKLADNSRLRKLGWSSVRPLACGIAQTYAAWLRETDSSQPMPHPSFSMNPQGASHR
jgi:GDP-L-fucose synthase